MQDDRVKSLAGYLDRTEAIRRTWKEQAAHDSADPWYRGLSKEYYSLMPTWYRDNVINSGLSERPLWDEFRRRSFPLLDGQHPRDRWEWMFLMQHYGLPTRLLDWSECSLVGLFFAVADWKGNGGMPTTDAIVWMLDPSTFNSWATEQNKWPSPTDEVVSYDDQRIAVFLCDDHNNLPKYPVALIQNYNSRRLVAQRGMFTIHGQKSEPFEAIYQSSDRFKRIVIDKDSILEIRESLRLAGVTDVLMFP